MTVTYCDVTGQEIENGTKDCAWRVRGRRYARIMGRDLSQEGARKVEDAVIAEMAKKKRFSFTEYKGIYKKTLTEMTE